MKLGFVLTFITAAATLAAAALEPAMGRGSESRSGAYLGVHIDQITPQTASDLKLNDASGALISYVDQDGPASKAGLKINDVVVGFNGSKVQSAGQLSEMIHAESAGKTVKLTVLRDGQRKDIAVTLGAWPNATAHARSMPPVPYMAFAPPSVKVPDVDVPSFNMLASRHGVVVESLCPQLADYFGVPNGQGVLVRSVEKGSPAEAAGLRAGDIITKVNNETVRDMADWRRAMHVRSGKLQVSVVRDKREQTLVLNLPESRDTSHWREQDSPKFEFDMQAFQQEMDKLAPELARSQTEMMAATWPSEQELEQMRQDIERSMKLSQKDIEKMVQKSVPSQEELQKQIEESMKLNQKDMEKMRIDIQAAMPGQEQWDQIRRDVEKSLEEWTPQMQEQLRQKLEDQQRNLQEMLKGFSIEHEL
jgi:hypothetical protein